MITLPLTIKMKRNCNLELCLLPSSSSSSAAASEPEYGHPHHLQNIRDQESSSSQHSSQPSQQLTMFYNGRVCVCDVTEFQARNILLLASREMEESKNGDGIRTGVTASTVSIIQAVVFNFTN
ncbi:uncharacterized protein LOC123219053 isoform X1 [Mangifera indica]|uniref:uncharacterized protein LOC123219053 isoform X1 n=1 Tax=Mangifera indica TaxID=29780 RepID=UPI001CF9EA52|nr:uncharacterized protein LOC123219053 isoform X1 [Mangifera indica]